MQKFKGIAISSGKVATNACVYSRKKHNKIKVRALKNDVDIQNEIQRFEAALSACSAELVSIEKVVSRKIGKVESEIFVAQKAIMNDPVIIKQIKDRTKHDKKNIEAVINEVFTEYEIKLSSIDNEYLSKRSTDIGEMRRRLIYYLSNTEPGYLCKEQPDCAKNREHIIIAEELTACMIVNINLEYVRGIITERGGINTHAGIIARSVGIPAVSGVKGIYKQVDCGMHVLVDGDTGTVILDPDEGTVRQIIPIKHVHTDDVCFLISPQGMETLANVSTIDDTKLATSFRADGIGLFRTEFSFIRAQRLLSEDEQFNFYTEVKRLMNGHPVTFRLLDVGGDKELPFFKTAKESNPFLGLRGARFLLENPEIFSTQVKALARLSKKGEIRILIPMVIDTFQLDTLINGIKEIITGVDAIQDNIKLGAMFEVPSACIQVNNILKRVDFASIGTNDLIQYLLAVDRNNEIVAQYYNSEHPALWNVLENLSLAAKRIDKPLSICGEMASQKGMAKRLLHIGITSLSVSPRLIPQVRHEMNDFFVNGKGV